MKTIRLSILLAILLLAGEKASSQSWQLVWQDDFNTIGPDWVFETGTGSGGWGNNELQYYRRENAYTQNGNLVIQARRESFGGMQYTSARMKTQGRKSWRYGRVEARMSMPSFQGVWPAFWMLGDNITSVGWPACGEIDIMEHVNTGGTVHGTIHWSDHNNNYANYGGYTNTSITAMHTYAIEWNSSYIRWFVDGAQYHEVNIQNGINGTSEFHNNFFILLNMAIGGNWPGFSIDNNAFPANMIVEYVRVYQLGTSNPTFTKTTQAESYSAMAGVQTETTTDAGGGSNVGWIDNGDWMAYNGINIPTSGSYLVEYRVASPNSTGRLSLDLNAGSIQLGALAVPNTGGWQNWRTISHTVNINAGTYNFGIFSQAGGWNINWWRITKTAGARLAPEVIASSDDLQIYPNPVIGNLNLKLPADFMDSKIKIISAEGIEVLNGKTFTSFDLSSLKPGVYSIIINKNGKLINKRFIKK